MTKETHEVSCSELIDYLKPELEELGHLSNLTNYTVSVTAQ